MPDEFDGVEAVYRVEPLRYWVPRLVRADTDWAWHGRAHEYLARTAGPSRLFRTAAFTIEHHADGGNRGSKFERELALLQADHRDHPDDPRTTFYLARTYEDGGEPVRAATWYRKRIEQPGWDEETWYARWRLGICLFAGGRDRRGLRGALERLGGAPVAGRTALVPGRALPPDGRVGPLVRSR